MIPQIFKAALFIIPFFPQSILATTCARSYVVQAGDICDSISAAKNVSTYQLAVVNAGIINIGCTNLMPGQTICLGNVGQDCSTTHLVVAGDTCDGITQVSGINNTMLYGNNPQINSECTNIYVGEVLCIANQIQAPPTPPSASMPATSIPATAVPPVPVPPVPATSSDTPSSPTFSPSFNTVPSATPTGDGDNDDLPWCDEL